MSQSPLRLALPVAADLAARIVDGLAPVCEPGYCAVVGSVRRRRPSIGDIEILAIPKFSAGLLLDVPGVSLLELELLAWLRQGRLLRANRGEALKRYYIPSLAREGHYFKLEINVSDAERWPVELAIKTGSANFSHRLVTPRNRLIAPGVYGLLPSHCVVRDGWQVWDGAGRINFEDEREFIEWACGEWVEPERRD